MVEMSYITMLVLASVFLVLGFYLTVQFIPEYKDNLSDIVCRIFSLLRGFIFREKHDKIPNKFETDAYDLLAKFIPLPCESRSFYVDSYDELLEVMSAQIMRCNDLFMYGRNNPLYPGGSGRNPFVCATIRYDLQGSEIIVSDFTKDLYNMPMSTQETDDRTLGSEISVYFQNEIFGGGDSDGDCSDCYVRRGWTLWKEKRFDPDAAPICSTALCMYGASVYWDYGFQLDSNYISSSGVMYVTFLDFPGKMITRMEIGNRACGFFEVVPPKEAAKGWQLGTYIGIKWDQARHDEDDRILICWTQLDI